MRTMEAWLWRCAAVIAAVMWGGGAAQGQCGGWFGGDAVPGVDGDVYAAVEWDRDGDGPEGAKWVVGGTFEVAGGVMARNIAAFDPATHTWSALSTGMSEGVLDTAVYALAVLPSGELVAGGIFGRAGGVVVNNVAKWNGQSWEALGAGTNGRVLALQVMPNSDLVAGGMFSSAGGGPVELVARWDGAVWNAVGSGLGTSAITHRVESFAFSPSGRLLACGTLATPPGETPRRSVAVWDGAAWRTYGGPITGYGLSVATHPAGYVAAVVLSYPTLRVVRSSGTGWTQLGSSISWGNAVIAASATGELVVGGNPYSFSSGPSAHVLRWNGVAWVAMGTGPNAGVRSLLPLSDGGWLAGGAFNQADRAAAPHIARWDGSRWLPLSEGLGAVRGLVAMPGGGVVVGGDFVTVHGVAAPHIARWDGAQWWSLGGGVNGSVLAVAALPNGDVLAGGEFTEAGGVAARRVARWDGTTWSSLGQGLNLPVSRLFAVPDGRVVAVMSPTVGTGVNLLSVWNGSAWTGALPAPQGNVDCVAILPDGRFALGGLFVRGPNPDYLGCFAILNGSTWSYYGSAFVSGRTGIGARVLASDRDGSLIVGGRFLFQGSTQLQSVLRWDGQALQSVGPLIPGPVNAITLLPNGDFVVGGEFTSSQPDALHHLARWDGAQWTEFAGGANGNVFALAMHGDQELIVGGEFGAVGGVVSSSFARYSLTGTPPIADQPDAQTLTDHDTLTISATPAAGYVGVAVRWQRDGVVIVDGPGGATSGGGTVTGAARALASPTNGTPAVLTIVGARMSDSGSYIATFVNACGEVATAAAEVSIRPCPADFDADGEVDGDDVMGFFGAWDSNNAAADFNNDGGVDSDDVIGFFGRWDSGC